MGIPTLERVVSDASNKAPQNPTNEFMILQGLATSVALCPAVTGMGITKEEFYNWYLKRLRTLYDQIAERRKIGGGPFSLSAHDPQLLALAQIKAILDSVPDLESRIGPAPTT